MNMYPGFIGTVLSHFLSLISTLWAILNVRRCNLQSNELHYIHFGLFLVAANSSLAIYRYGSFDGYKLRRLHLLLLNLSTILYFTIIEGIFLNMIKSSWLTYILPLSNAFSLFSNIFAKDYRTKIKKSDVFIAVNFVFLLFVSFIHENYFGVVLSLSYFFGYFVIGESGYFLDTEVPSVDAFQYLTCFLNYFAVYTLCF